MTRLSPTLTARRGSICCAECGHALAAVQTSWKAHAVVIEVPARSLPGASAVLHGEVTVRQFSCPSCHRLLDTETALQGDPFLEDVIEIQEPQSGNHM